MPHMRIDTPFQRLLSWLHLHLVDHGIIRLMYNNLYQVTPGVFRASQPSASQLARYQQRYGIRTVINLRGENPQQGFYLLEQEACERLGITFINHKLYSRALPSKEAIHATAELLRQVEYPILFHCKSGADRAGLMATLCRIFLAGDRVEDAIHQLDWYYGHFKFAKTGMIDFFFQAYLDHCRDSEQPLPFLQWVEDVYDPDSLRGQFHDQWWASVITDSLLRRE